MTVTVDSPVTLYSLLANHAGTDALKAGRVTSPRIAASISPSSSICFNCFPAAARSTLAGSRYSARWASSNVTHVTLLRSTP